MPPDQLLTTLLIQALYGVRSGRQLMKRLGYRLLPGVGSTVPHIVFPTA